MVKRYILLPEGPARKQIILNLLSQQHYSLRQRLRPYVMLLVVRDWLLFIPGGMVKSRLQNKKSDRHPFSRHLMKGTSLSEGNYLLKYSKTRGLFLGHQHNW